MLFEHLTFTTGLVLTIGMPSKSGIKTTTVLHFINYTNKALHGVESVWVELTAVYLIQQRVF